MPLDISSANSTKATSERSRKYKAKIAFVSPPANRELFERNDVCFLGVSLENSNFTERKLDSMTEWISRRFSNCLVLIGDSIHRITLQSTRGLDPDSSLEEALRLGREFIANQRHVFERYRAKTEFTFQTCSEVQAGDSYLHYYQQLEGLFVRDQTFRESVESFGREYHKKHSNNFDGSNLARRVSMSSVYFLEEFAIFSCLQRKGIPVMIYPGSFSSLSEIASGEHPGAPRELKNLTVVSLHLKGR